VKGVLVVEVQYLLHLRLLQRVSTRETTRVYEPYLKLEKRRLDLQKDPGSFRLISKSLDFKSSTSAPLPPASTSKDKKKPSVSAPAPSDLVNKLAAIANSEHSNRGDTFHDGDAGIDQPSRSMSFTDAAVKYVD
jgi:hypothetical protein